MYIPCGGVNLPARLCVRVIAARNLPVMDKSNDTTDAFVEVHLGSQTYKTEICCKSLSPTWNSDDFVFETDEQHIFNNHIIFRIMDYDVYSANDPIGRVLFDANLLVAEIRQSGNEANFIEYTAWLPIYDTILGMRGEINVYISLKLLVSNGAAHYVRILSAKSVHPQFQIVAIIGLLSDIQTTSDPEFQWIDRIRPPRTSNDARQQIIWKSLRDLARILAQKAYSLGANYILGYQEFADIEGENTGQISFRAYGTALKLVSRENVGGFVERIPHPLISLNSLPNNLIRGSAAIVCARAVHVLDDDIVSIDVKKKWWNELRLELLKQAFSLRCNLVIGYIEQLTIRNKIVLLSCMGTAVSINVSQNDCPSSPCSLFHVPYLKENLPFNVNLSPCLLCGEGQSADLFISNCCVPSSNYLVGQRIHIQAIVTRKNLSSESDEQLAMEISKILPFLEHELHDKLLQELSNLNSHMNAIFNLRTFFIIGDGFLVAVACGIGCSLKAIANQFPSAVHSAASLLRIGDSRRFSWNSMYDAMRFRGPLASTNNSVLCLRALPLKNSFDAEGSDGRHPRRKMEWIVDKFRKKTGDRSGFAKMIFDREMGLKIGITADHTVVLCHGHAGIYIVGNSGDFVVTCDDSQTAYHPLTRHLTVLIREKHCQITDVDMDGLIEMGFADSFRTIKSHVNGINCSGVANFSIPSTDLDVSRDHAYVLLLVTTDVLHAASSSPPTFTLRKEA